MTEAGRCPKSTLDCQNQLIVSLGIISKELQDLEKHWNKLSLTNTMS